MAVSQTLTVTEVAGSINESANTSRVRILWKSTQTGDSHNDYTRTAKYYVSINGGAETEYSVSYTLPQSSTKTILDTTITVTHKNDGSGSVKVRTWMDTSISAGVVEKTQSITLTTIPRASTITSASDRTLGNACAVKWTPLSQSFRYKLKFTLGNFSYTTGAIHPNTTSAYTYIGYTLRIADIAPQITDNPPIGTMNVTLFTYSDSAATIQVGSASSTTFKVTVPDNSSTKPDLTMTLTPVSSLGSAFAGLYIQGKSRVKATFSGSGKYSTTISSYGVTVLGKSYASPYQTDYLSQSDTVTVYGRATDSRGFVTEKSEDITVIPYGKPKLIHGSGISSIVCERCDSSGNTTESGTYLKIKVGRSYSKVMSGGTQKNFCLLRYRYKVASASEFSDYITLLSKDDTSTDYVDVTLGNVVSSVSSSYVVELSVIDDIGDSAKITFVVPTEDITLHLREGGSGAAFGKYAEKEKTLEVASDWDMYYKEHLLEEKFYNLGECHKRVQKGDDFNDYTTFGVYAVADPTTLELLNCPSSVAGTLIVSSSTGIGSNSGAWVYILQRFIIYDGTSVYYRLIHTDGDGEWIFQPWKTRSEKTWANLGFSDKVSASVNPIGRNTDGTCCYRVINENHVYVSFNCAFTYSGNPIKVSGNPIPSQYKPTRYVYATCPTTGRALARIYISTSGDVMIDHVQDVASASPTTSFEAGWIDGYIDYWL